ncbi:MAG: hypothetical protein ACFWUE_03355 [Xylanivirga thermophila]|jgi:uncharacterized membrane protein
MKKLVYAIIIIFIVFLLCTTYQQVYICLYHTPYMDHSHGDQTLDIIYEFSYIVSSSPQTEQYRYNMRYSSKKWQTLLILLIVCILAVIRFVFYYRTDKIDKRENIIMRIPSYFNGSKYKSVPCLN